MILPMCNTDRDFFRFIDREVYFTCIRIIGFWKFLLLPHCQSKVHYLFWTTVQNTPERVRFAVACCQPKTVGEMLDLISNVTSDDSNDFLDYGYYYMRTKSLLGDIK